MSGYLVIPVADGNNLANAQLFTSSTLSGLANGTSYRAWRLSEASEPFTPQASGEQPGPTGPATIALTFQIGVHDDPVITTDSAGRLYWAISTQTSRTAQQIVAGTGAAHSGSVETEFGVLTVDLPGMDPAPDYWLHVVLALPGTNTPNSNVASAKVQDAYVAPPATLLQTWDFTAGAFPSEITIARPDGAAGRATLVNSSGTRIAVAANTARLDYLDARGLLLEPRRHRILGRSTVEGLGLTGVVRTSLSGADVEPNGVSSFRLQSTAVPNRAGQVITANLILAQYPATPWDISVEFRVKYVSGHPVIKVCQSLTASDISPATTVEFNTQTRQVVSQGEDVTNVAVVEEASGWARLKFTSTGRTGNQGVVIAFDEIGTVIDCGHQQLEIGSTPSSIIGAFVTGSMMERAQETLTLSANLGNVDLRLVTPAGDIDLPGQTLDGAWTYTPADPLKVLRIEAHAQGTL